MINDEKSSCNFNMCPGCPAGDVVAKSKEGQDFSPAGAEYTSCKRV